ncbi:MAG TPA: tRNA pseudouridine(55) synthase TruB [Phycisphaerae bacterium]|nr:tRNA pseudouridine(55) synthase TruB [Phycisphaerae bacterium]HRW54189.1 tRNA pseudouridine(55) synthase TruB [Phycisphaerae bacterium]
MTQQYRHPNRRKRNAEPRVSGVVNLYKPVWQSSAKYVYKLRDVFDEWKVGHAGTLDPFADGVVLACVGRATKLVERLMGLPKTYTTNIRLGVTNETFDTERPFEPVPGAAEVSREALDAALAPFHGEIDQCPPAFSAVKIDGVSSYRLARKGAVEDRPPKRIIIHDLSILEYAWPVVRLRIVCGRGAYIRAIARDLGAALGCGACCETLRRDAVGPFHVDSALRLEEADPEQRKASLIPLERVLEMLGDQTP